MEELKTTDIVQLNAGGPKMSIIRFIGADISHSQLRTADDILRMQGFVDGDVICQWFVDDKLHSGTFKRESLKVLAE
jgi:uncharacterized protein YodC (DUF2158 family)